MKEDDFLPQPQEHSTEALAVTETQEILSNSIDIVSTENLKFKSPFGLASIFMLPETGLISREVMAPTTPEIGRKWKSIKDNPRKQAQNNVFFPQASLSELKKYVEGENIDNTVGKRLNFSTIHQINSAIRILRFLIDRSNLEVDKNDEARIKSILLIPSGDREVHLPIENKKTVLDFLSKYNKEIVSSWNKKFLKEVEECQDPDKLESSGFRGDTQTNLIGYQYGFDIAYILSADVPATPALRRTFDSDYPTEAVIDEMRVPPRKFKGLIINRKIFKDSRLEDFISKDTNKPLDNDNIAFFKRAKFEFPKDRGVLSRLIKEIEDYGAKYFENFLLTEYGGDRERVDMVLDILINRSEEYSADTLEKAYRTASSFLQSYIPIHDGETIWDGIVEIAKKHKIPVYDTSGKIIWPQV